MPGTEQANRARTLTAQISNREEREPRRLSGPKFALAGASFLICREQWGRVQKYPVTQPRMFLEFPGLK